MKKNLLLLICIFVSTLNGMWNNADAAKAILAANSAPAKVAVAQKLVAWETALKRAIPPAVLAVWNKKFPGEDFHAVANGGTTKKNIETVSAWDFLTKNIGKLSSVADLTALAPYQQAINDLIADRNNTTQYETSSDDSKQIDSWKSAIDAKNTELSGDPKKLIANLAKDARKLLDEIKSKAAGYEAELDPLLKP